MLQKSGGGKARSGFFKFVRQSAKILFVAELVAFGATYLVWYRLNTNRGKWMKRTCGKSAMNIQPAGPICRVFFGVMSHRY